MKKIEAVIRKSKFPQVKEALNTVEVYYFSYREVVGLSNETKDNVYYRGVSYSSADVDRLQLTIVVNDAFEKITIETLLQFSKTGSVGDGFIYVSEVNESYRIRTQEKGSISLF